MPSPTSKAHSANGTGEIRIGHAVSDPKAGEPVRLGEGAEHRNVWPFGDHVQAAQTFRVSDEFHIRLIERDQDVIR